MILEKIAEQYLKVIPLKHRVKAYTVKPIKDTFKRGVIKGYVVVEGEGYIASNGSWNYHNNYDDSEPTLWFVFPDAKGSIEQQWWSVSKEEADLRCASLLKEEIEKLEKRIETFKTYLTQ